MKDYLKNNIDQAQMADVLDELPFWSAPFGLKLLEYVDYQLNITALDIGFGTGFRLTELAMRLGESSVIYGIDPWKEASSRAQQKINAFGISNIRIIEGIAESIPLDDASVDLIVSNNGINNVNDIGKVISECSRILKTGGQFVLTMNTDNTMVEFYEQMEIVLSELNLFDSIDLMHRYIYQKRRPIEEIISMLKRNGFVIRDLVHDQFDYRFADGSAMLNHYFIRVAFMDSWMGILPGDKVEPVFDAIESRLNQKAQKLGGIKLSVPH